MKVQLKNVRLAFPQLWEAKTVNGEGKPAFSATFLFPPGSPNEKAMSEAISAVAKEKWGAKADATLKTIKASNKTCLQDGAMKAEYAGFDGNLYVSARNETRPTVVDGQRNPLTQADGKPYGGCYVNAIVDIWAMDNSYGKRVCASLSGVQFVRDGEAFSGGGAASADDFDAITEGADADDLA